GACGEPLAAASRELQAGPRQIDAVGAAIAPQPREVVSGAAPAIEDVERRFVGGSGGDEWFDESTEAAEPEMITFDARGRLEEPDHRGNLGRQILHWCGRRSQMKSSVRVLAVVALVGLIGIGACGKKKPATAPAPP